MKTIKQIVNKVPTIIVMSNKGGVGKTSVAASLALSFASDFGKRVALIDVDITNPSIPHVFGLGDEEPEVNVLVRPIRHPDLPIEIMSVGFFLPEEDQYIALDGPTKKQTIDQFAISVGFSSETDIVVVDSPPTTSDEIMQTLSIFPRKNSGAVIVTQPSSMSLNGACKTMTLLRSKGYLVKGFVTNMDGLVCERCGHCNALFHAERTVEEVAESYGVPHIGSIPMVPGHSEIVFQNGHFRKIAQSVLEEHGVQFKPPKKMNVAKKLFKGLRAAWRLKKEAR